MVKEKKERTAYLLKVSDPQGIHKVPEQNPYHQSSRLLRIPKQRNHRYWLQPSMNSSYCLMMQQSLPTFSSMHCKPDQIFRLCPKAYSLLLNFPLCSVNY
ncbi:unnamed protein product [Prunus brigantina]